MNYKHLPPVPDLLPQDQAAVIRWLMNHKVWEKHGELPATPSSATPSQKKVAVDVDLGEVTEPSGFLALADFDSGFENCTNFIPVLVNPLTGMIDDDDNLNTELRIWCEAGPWGPDERNHDLRLDCGGEDMTEVLLQLAVRVKTFYHEDGTPTEIRPCWWGGAGRCPPNLDVGEFCPHCHFERD